MIQPSMERTATAPVEVRVSLVAGAPVPWVGDTGDSTGSMSISVEAIVVVGNGRWGWLMYEVQVIGFYGISMGSTVCEVLRCEISRCLILR